MVRCVSRGAENTNAVERAEGGGVRASRVICAAIAVIAALLAFALTGETAIGAPTRNWSVRGSVLAATSSATSRHRSLDAPSTTTSTTQAPVTGGGAPPAGAATAGASSGVPYAVGVLSATVTDTTRTTDARGDTPASPERSLALTIRYPTAGTDDTADVSNAPARPGAYPLVVFAHGFDSSAATYATLEHQLASAGFVVVAPDFPLTSSIYPGAPIEDDVSNQAADVSFVITTMLDPTRSPGQLSSVIAPGAVGVVGHSDGGVTAAAVAYNSTVADSRIGAAVILSGAEARYDGSWFTTQSPPLLAVHGTDDEINPYADSTQLVADATGTKYLATVVGGSHLGPFTTDASEPDVARLAGDFLLASLEGDTQAQGRITTDGTIPGELELDTSG
jgi:fermentation-respiration switch protein FrsA (DUF1100 family)